MKGQDTYQDLEVLQSVSKALGSLLEFPQALPGAKVVTVSHLKPVLALFNTEVLAVKSEDTNLTKTSKKPFWAT
ncbi:hypothetical protein ATANTOWER_020765 [Ataeniobius toweri]|uniref:Uncharacterized protein n=1 Tax=Ataeniobius toweri TaxID=208326 RepID=A0ABU7A879_9TELE|nr:hypothetical protein [Ataeniobius toweri]